MSTTRKNASKPTTTPKVLSGTGIHVPATVTRAIASIGKNDATTAVRWLIVWNFTDAALADGHKRDAVASALAGAGLANVKAASVTQYRNGARAVAAYAHGTGADLSKDGAAIAVFARHIGNGVGGARMTEFIASAVKRYQANPKGGHAAILAGTAVPDSKPVNRAPRTAGDGTDKGKSTGARATAEKASAPTLADAVRAMLTALEAHEGDWSAQDLSRLAPVAAAIDAARLSAVKPTATTGKK